MIEARRLEALEGFLVRLRQEVEGSAILVEGKRDVNALEQLGLGGVHLRLNKGRSVAGRADELAVRAKNEGWVKIYLLMDADRTGARLQEQLEAALVGRTPVDTQARSMLFGLVQCRCVEDVPPELYGLRQRVPP